MCLRILFIVMTEIKQFDPSTIKKINNMIILGDETSHFGLMLIEKFIIDVMKKSGVEYNTAMANAHNSHDYMFKPLIPDVFIHNNTDQSQWNQLLSNVIKRQIELIRRMNDDMDESVEKDANIDLFLGLSLNFLDFDINRDEMMRNIFMNDRHFRMFTMMVLNQTKCDDRRNTQYENKNSLLSPMHRVNLECLVMVPTKKISQIKNLYQRYVQSLDGETSFEQFKAMMSICYNNNSLLILCFNKQEYKHIWYYHNNDNVPEKYDIICEETMEYVRKIDGIRQYTI